MVLKKIQFTKEGLEKLNLELKDLQDVKRPGAVEKLERARGMGDLSENSAYTSARDELSLLEGRIQELEEVIRNAEVVESAPTDGSIAIGTHVTVEINNDVEDIHVVGEFEADPMNKKLSYTSPIGKALIGKKVGDIIEIQIPSGSIKYKILSIK
jgi:transcription elongation factor GreA